MSWLRPLIIAALLGPLPASAGPIAGADDPAYRSALTRLLTTDDPAALTALHALAATNRAALIALPVAATWVPLPAELREVNGDWAADLAAAAYKPAALWQGGAISPMMRDQLIRALWLYELGESAKADALLSGWFNHMPDTAALPEGFNDLAAAPWLKAMIMEQHIARGDHKALATLQYWLDHDRIEGWMALSAATDYYSGQGGKPMIASLTLGANAGARLQDGRLARRLLWQQEPPAPVPAATVQIIIQDLLPSPQFAPLRAYCAARCPTTLPACEAAFVTIFAQPYHTIAAQTPYHDLISAADFFATPRGEQVLLGPALTHRLGLDRVDGYQGALADNPALQAASAIDACLTAGAIRALSPLP